MDNLINVEIYSRPGCHLCDEAKGVIERVIKRLEGRMTFVLQIVNVETDPKLEKEYGEEVPVVVINGNKAFKYRVDEVEFEEKVRFWKT